MLYTVTKYSTQSETWPEKALRTPKSYSLIITTEARLPPQKEYSKAPVDPHGKSCVQFIQNIKKQEKSGGLISVDPWPFGIALEL